MADPPAELQAEIEKLEARHAGQPEGRFFVPLANAYRKTGEIERAEAVLREGLRRHPDYLSAHIVLGRCLADRGATREAVQEFEHVLSVDPQNLIALRTLGELSMSAGRPQDSERWYEQLLAVDPMNEDARHALDALSGGAAPPDASRGAAFAGSDAGATGGGTQAAAPTDLYGGIVDLDDDGGAGDDGEAQGGAGEVVTETIAELYLRQGLQDRAIEVYRELVRRRGGDAALERRIAELTAPPAPAPAAESFAAAASEPQPFSGAGAEAVEPARAPDAFTEPLPGLGVAGASPDPAGDLSPAENDPFAASFAYGFLDAELTGLELAHDTAPLPDWTDAGDDPALAPPRTAPTIADYLLQLAAWRSGEVASTLAPAEEPPVEVDSYDPRAPEPASTDDLLLDELVLDSDGVDPEPWVTRTSLAETAPGDSPSSPPAPVDDLTFPWEIPGGDVSEGPGSAQEEERLAFDSFFPDAETPAAPEPETAAPPAPVPPSAPVVAQEEDDLESFQAWLRSLKR